MFHDQSEGNPFARPLNRLLAILVCVLVLAICFSGCANSQLFANRIQCSVDGNSASLVSMYAGFGIATQLSEADARAICKREGVKL